MTEMTAAGAQARSVARWAWQDPRARAVDALEQVNELAARADPADLAEIQDAAAMLNRLASSVSSAPRQPYGIAAHLSRPVTVSEQVELAAVHGRHVPGTAYTFRHGWIPLVGEHFNDKYPGFVHAGRYGNVEQRRRAMAQAKAALAQGGQDIKVGKGSPAPVNAGRRVLSPEQKKMVAAARAKTSLRSAAGAPPASKPPEPSSGDAMASAAVFDKAGLLGPANVRDVTPRVPADHVAAARSAVAAVRPADFKPGSAGEKLAQTDPGLASLAMPGASMAALKTYIDARVAAEVARQVGQITAKQNEEIQAKLASVHKGQQKIISHMRKTVGGITDTADHADRTHLVMYNMFNMAGVALAVGGLTFGLTPVVAALAAFAVPLTTTIHDYVRGM